MGRGRYPLPTGKGTPPPRSHPARRPSALGPSPFQNPNYTPLHLLYVSILFLRIKIKWKLSLDGHFSRYVEYWVAHVSVVTIVVTQSAQPSEDVCTVPVHGRCSDVTKCEHIQGGAKNGATGHPISLQIFRKLHDRIAWKLVDFCNIICWTQSFTFCFKISSRCGAT